MANRLVLMPVCPNTTVSEALNFLVKTGRAEAHAARPLEPTQAAPKPRAACKMKSRRFMVPPKEPVAPCLTLIYGLTTGESVNRLFARVGRTLLSAKSFQRKRTALTKFTRHRQTSLLR